MELVVKRKTFTEKSTIGELFIDGKFFCWTLEDKDRGFSQADNVLTIKAKKLFAITAIPYGRYKVTLTDSSRFGKLLPLLNDVKGFAGIRIHPGNKPEDTEGCILLGYEMATDSVLKSRMAFIDFMANLRAAIDRKEDIFITVEKSAATA